jgi:hypothetical protein
MSRSWPSWLSVAALAAAVGLMAARSERQDARAYAAAGAAGWEYQTASVELASLATKLTEFGRDGWEVFSLMHTDGVVDTGADGKPHIVYLRAEVTAKRPKMP